MSLLTRHTPPAPAPVEGRADSLVLDRRTLRRIRAEARKTAATGWTPTPSQAEPPYLHVIDHQAAAAAHQAVERYHHTQTRPLTTLRTWLRATPTLPPVPGSHGPAARQQALTAAAWAQLSDDADHNLTIYDHNRDALAAELGRIDRYRRTARHTFWTALTAHHPTPNQLTTSTADHDDTGHSGIDLPEDPDVTEARHRLYQLRQTPTP